MSAREQYKMTKGDWVAVILLFAFAYSSAGLALYQLIRAIRNLFG